MTDGHRRALLIVAAVTPLTEGGAALDAGAIGPYTAHLEMHGADGAFVCGTTGEGVLLSIEERRQVAIAFRAAVRGHLIVHAGAQTTTDTARLAAHAAEIGADAVGVIAPPYYALDADALTAHFVAAARACAPLPFYCYAFAARSGYPLPVEVVERIRQAVDNLAGLKVSESPWSAVAPYLSLGLPVLIGNEPLIPQGLRAGAIGSVSGMAAALPEVVRAALDDPSPTNEARLVQLRAAMEVTGSFIGAAKQILALRGIPIHPDVRSPLRALSSAEAAALESAIQPLLAAAT